jgi:sec-independent protein translocase protein TatB
VFDVGFWELLFIFTLALLVLGPDKLPGVVSTVGRWTGRAKSLARSLRLQIEREMAEDQTVRPSPRKTTPTGNAATATPPTSSVNDTPTPSPATDEPVAASEPVTPSEPVIRSTSESAAPATTPDSPNPAADPLPQVDPEPTASAPDNKP